MADNTKNSSNMLAQIYREVGETKTAVNNLEDKLQRHIDHSLKELSKINKLDAEQNRILDEHILGVKTLQELYVSHRQETLEMIEILKESLETQKKEYKTTLKGLEVAHDSRLEKLERPHEFLKTVKVVAGWILAVGGAIILIINMIKGL